MKLLFQQKHSLPSSNWGFSLVEMAIVLAIVALLMAGLLPTLSGQIEQSRRNETLKYMNEVRDALFGYAISNKHLPCPDSANDGTAEATCTTAISQVGKLPYKDLGVPPKDSYGNVLVYAVTKEFANSGDPITLSTVGTMRVCTTTTPTCTDNLTNNAVAVIISLGANGTNTFSADEAENTYSSTNTDFVSHDLSQNSFDDLVIWISPNLLFNRMVTAGQLP